MNEIIELKKLYFYYNNKKIINNINLKIAPGKFYSIIGPNGSGKTTLLKLIDKQLPIKKETIFIEKKDIYLLNEKEIAKKISMVPQNINILFNFKVKDIVLMGRIPYLNFFSNETERDFNIVKKAMIKTKILHLKDKNINSISGGEMQRVILARALAQESKIMLLDEAISNLDIYHQLDIIEMLKKMVKNGITVICVMHNLNLASKYSDKIILLKNGSIIKIGNPKNTITKDLIEKLYNIKVNIIENPDNKNPLIINSYIT